MKTKAINRKAAILAGSRFSIYQSNVGFQQSFCAVNAQEFMEIGVDGWLNF